MEVEQHPNGTRIWVRQTLEHSLIDIVHHGDTFARIEMTAGDQKAEVIVKREELRRVGETFIAASEREL